MMTKDAKMMAIKHLRDKIKMLMEEGGEPSMSEELMDEEKGPENMAEDAREMGEVDSAVDGEDGEKEVSIEIEAEGSGQGMEELYKRMADEFGSMPKSRQAAGKKKALFAGSPKPDMMMKKKK